MKNIEIKETVVSKSPICVGMLHIPGKNDKEWREFCNSKPKSIKSNCELIYGEFYK